MVNSVKAKSFNPFDLEAAIETQKRIYVLNNTDPRGLLICTVNDPVSADAIAAIPSTITHAIKFVRFIVVSNVTPVARAPCP